MSLPGYASLQCFVYFSNICSIGQKFPGWVYTAYFLLQFCHFYNLFVTCKDGLKLSVNILKFSYWMAYQLLIAGRHVWFPTEPAQMMRLL